MTYKPGDFVWTDEDGFSCAVACGNEGSCAACGKPMRPNDRYRIADGRITHLECVRDWEARRREVEGGVHQFSKRA